MAIDSTIAVRRGIITSLAADVRVTAIVPAVRIYPMTAVEPVWPFILYGSPSALPLRGSCLDGGEITVAVHGFAKARASTGVSDPGETAEDHAGRLGKAIAAVLDGRKLTIPRGTAAVRWTGSQLLLDRDEADAFHCVVNLRVRCITA